jgi:hypothetical protein
MKISKIVGGALPVDRNDVRRISGMPIIGSTQSAKGRSVRGVGGALRTTRTIRARTRTTRKKRTRMRRTRKRTIKKRIKSLKMKIGRFYFLLHL